MTPEWLGTIFSGGTFLAVLTLLSKFMRWTGTVDTKLNALWKWYEETRV